LAHTNSACWRMMAMFRCCASILYECHKNGRWFQTSSTAMKVSCSNTVTSCCNRVAVCCFIKQWRKILQNQVWRGRIRLLVNSSQEARRIERMWPTLRQACNKDQWAAWPAILRHDAGGHRKGSRECSPAKHRLDNLLVVPLANGSIVSNPQTITASVSSNLPCTVLAVTTESLDCLIADAQYQQHPYGKVWQRFDTDAFAELVSNVQSRGLDQEIILYQEMVLEGWHRYLACLLSNTEPRFVEFKGTDLQAAEKVHASGVRRQSSADQRYAAFTMLGDACPDFRAKYETQKQQGIGQKCAGTPLSTDGQRVDVLGAKAAAAGVSRSTAAKVEKCEKAKSESCR
jgi:hypothetical protein